MFYVLEGANSSGKSGILEKIAKILREENFEVIITREPGGSKIGTDIRKMLLTANYDLDDYERLLLFLTDRRIDYKENIKPYRNKNNVIVLSDRYWESTIVYQSLLGEIDLEYLKKRHQDFIAKDFIPDMTFIINSDKPHLSNEEDVDNIDKGGEFRKKAVKAYRSLKDKLNYPIINIDTTKGNWKNYANDIAQKIILKENSR